MNKQGGGDHCVGGSSMSIVLVGMANGFDFDIALFFVLPSTVLYIYIYYITVNVAVVFVVVVDNKYII